MTQSKKTVDGITLKKTFGKNHHNWVANFNGYMVRFSPFLGRYNNKVNGWEAIQVLCSHLEPSEKLYARGPSLISVVREIKEKAIVMKDAAIDQHNRENGVKWDTPQQAPYTGCCDSLRDATIWPTDPHPSKRTY